MAFTLAWELPTSRRQNKKPGRVATAGFDLGDTARSVVRFVVLHHFVHFVLGAQYDRHPLVQTGGLHGHDALAARGARAARLLDDEGHGIGLVHQAQLAAFFLGLAVDGVHEDAAAREDTVHLGHHRGDPAHVEILGPGAVLALQTLVDIALHWLFPEALVGSVDRELLGVGRDLDVGVGEIVFADVAVERKAVHAVAAGDHQHGGRPVQRVTGADLLGAGLQEVFGGDFFFTFGRFQDREDRAHRDVDVDVARAVERIEQQQVLALRVLRGDGQDLVHFLRGHAREVARPVGGFDHHIIGDHVELLLILALHVLGAGTTQHARERALVHGVRDHFGGGDDIVEQQSELAGGAGDAALLFDDELGDGDAGGHNASSNSDAKSVTLSARRRRAGAAAPLARRYYPGLNPQNTRRVPSGGLTWLHLALPWRRVLPAGRPHTHQSSTWTELV